MEGQRSSNDQPVSKFPKAVRPTPAATAPFNRQAGEGHGSRADQPVTGLASLGPFHALIFATLVLARSSTSNRREAVLDLFAFFASLEYQAKPGLIL